MAVDAGMQKKKWHIRPADPRAAEFAKQLRISPPLAQVLLNRDVSELHQARSFLTPKLTDLIEPGKMPGTEKAVERIKQALTDGEKIAIYGDYDVDGITSVSILWHLLTTLGANVEYYNPPRI
jgi:single-stranded-DNA-specific exonuclease